MAVPLDDATRDAISLLQTRYKHILASTEFQEQDAKFGYIVAWTLSLAELKDQEQPLVQLGRDLFNVGSCLRL